MKLYYFPLSPYSQKVLIAFFEKFISVDHVPINLFSQSDEECEKLIELKQIYPLGRLPVLVDEDKVIGESSLIIEYAEALGERALIPKDSQLAWQVRYLTAMADNYITDSARRLYFQLQRPEDKRNMDLVKRARSTLLTMYKEVDRQLTGQTQYMVSEDFSLADCAMWPALSMAHELYPIPSRYSTITAYLQQLSARKSIVDMMLLTGSKTD